MAANYFIRFLIYICFFTTGIFGIWTTCVVGFVGIRIEKGMELIIPGFIPSPMALLLNIRLLSMKPLFA